MPASTKEPSTLRAYLPRLAAPLIMAGLAVAAVDLLFPTPRLALVAVVLIFGGAALLFIRTERQHDHAAITVRPPVRGRWMAVNSPADKVPSHGTRELGQTYAIDLVYQPDESSTWRGVHRWPPARRPKKFPAFGEPILAPADGVVVRATGWQRDHLSRNSVLGLVYLIPEMIVRAIVSLITGYFVLGNHVILDLGDGVHAVFAHLRRGSVRVRKGQHVRVGEQLAECGNSGNTSEPHLHFHLMDRRSPVVAIGVPFSFDHYEIGGTSHLGVPGGHVPFVVYGPASTGA